MIDYEKEASTFLNKNISFKEKKFKSNKIQCAILNYVDTKLDYNEEKLVRAVLNEFASERDIEQLLDITCQIKAIQKQGIILLGEKIFKAREIINKNPLRKTSFSSWINISFKTKSSAYNALSYYELYSNLSNDELRNTFLNIPYKAAYRLSSKNICIEDKENIIPHLSGLSNSEAISVISNLSYEKCDKSCNKKFFMNIKSRLVSIFNDILREKVKDPFQAKEIIKITKLIENELSD